MTTETTRIAMTPHEAIETLVSTTPADLDLATYDGPDKSIRAIAALDAWSKQVGTCNDTIEDINVDGLPPTLGPCLRPAGHVAQGVKRHLDATGRWWEGQA